jgi:hypothetical protein
MGHILGGAFAHSGLQCLQLVCVYGKLRGMWCVGTRAAVCAHTLRLQLSLQWAAEQRDSLKTGPFPNRGVHGQPVTIAVYLLLVAPRALVLHPLTAELFVPNCPGSISWFLPWGLDTGFLTLGSEFQWGQQRDGWPTEVSPCASQAPLRGQLSREVTATCPLQKCHRDPRHLSAGRRVRTCKGGCHLHTPVGG